MALSETGSQCCISTVALSYHRYRVGVVGLSLDLQAEACGQTLADVLAAGEAEAGAGGVTVHVHGVALEPVVGKHDGAVDLARSRVLDRLSGHGHRQGAGHSYSY